VKVFARQRGAQGFTLIELIMTLTVLTVMTLGVIPLIKVSVRRQREQQLREELRQLRAAIDQFHREAIVGALLQQRGGTGGGGTGGGGGGGLGGGGGQPYIDPRVRVGITDQLIFGSDNPDRYPPDLETLVKGVSVMPIPGATGGAGGGIVGLGDSTEKATDNTLTSTKKKIYLRSLPIDPMTGEADWDLRSTYDSADSSSWGGENVFDVRSKSTGTALDGTKYNEW
jgi:general secretion pathway protein G